MISLSFSSMNALVNEPHTWLCRQMGLKTYSTESFDLGKACHRVIQDHVCGTKTHPLLASLPQFSEVETEDFDPKMKINIPIDDQYEIIGFVDAKNPETGEFLEIKSGRKWSPRDFANLAQWKIYSVALEGYSKVWFVNVPKRIEEWNADNVRIFNAQITPLHKQQATLFVKRAIDIIEHIDTLANDFKRLERRSNHCFYEGCPWCPNGYDQQR